MTRKFVITRVEEDADIILADDAEQEAIEEIIADDLTETDLLPKDATEEERRIGIEMGVALSGIGSPPYPTEKRILGRRYRVEELPNDPRVAAEFFASRSSGPRLIGFLCKLPGPLRFIIWTNERTHRGRPHCLVEYGDKSATFGLPDGELLSGDLRPKEGKARRMVQKYADELLRQWHRSRPDDQRL